MATGQATNLDRLGERLGDLQKGLEDAQTGTLDRLPAQQLEDEGFILLSEQIAAAREDARTSLRELEGLASLAVRAGDAVAAAEWAFLRERAEQRARDGGPLSSLAREVEALKSTRDSLEAVLRATLVARRRVASAKDGENLGQDLLADGSHAPSSHALEQAGADLARQLSRTQVELLELESIIAERRRDPVQVSPELSARGRTLAAKLRGEYRELVRMQQVHVALHEEYEAAAEMLRDFVDQQVLWAQSIEGSYIPRADVVRKAFLWLLDPEEWAQTGSVLHAYAAAHTAEAIWLVVAVLVLVLGRSRMRGVLAEAALGARGKGQGSFRPTVMALVASAWLVALGPLLFWIVSRVFTAAPGVGDLHLAVGQGLRAGSVVYATAEFLRALVLKGGLGEAHFRWTAETTACVRRELRWFTPLAVLGVVVTLTLERQSEQEWQEDAGRVVFMLQSLLLAVFTYRLLGKQSRATIDYLKRHPEGLLARSRRLWFPLSVLGPVALAVLAFRGYFYSALEINGHVQHTAVLILVLILVNELARRWLWVTRRNLRLEQARQRAEARDTTADGELVEDEPDLGALDAQTRQLFTSSVTLATVVGLWLIWSSMIPALGGLGRVQLWPKLGFVAVTEPFGPDFAELDRDANYEDYGVGETRASAPTPGLVPGAGVALGGTLAKASDDDVDAEGELFGGVGAVYLDDAALAVLLLALTMIAARNIPALIEIVLLQRLPMDSGSRLAVTTLGRYLIGIIGLTLTFGAVGIGWSSVQWMAAALTFGLAFGLQEIFANFVSGLIILIERPIRVGDIVTVDGVEGRVSQLRMRSTTITDYDRKELLVPNKSFITNSLINWTLSDPVTRIVVEVGIAYGSDTRVARQLMLREARNCTLVLEDPAPHVIFRAFGDSSLDFQLRAFISNRDAWAEAYDALHTRIDDAFREAGVEIAFPQRDLHLRSAPGLEPFGLESPGPESPGPESPGPESPGPASPGGGLGEGPGTERGVT